MAVATPPARAHSHRRPGSGKRHDRPEDDDHDDRHGRGLRRRPRTGTPPGGRRRPPAGATGVTRGRRRRTRRFGGMVGPCRGTRVGRGWPDGPARRGRCPRPARRAPTAAGRSPRAREGVSAPTVVVERCASDEEQRFAGERERASRALGSVGTDDGHAASRDARSPSATSSLRRSTRRVTGSTLRGVHRVGTSATDKTVKCQRPT